MTLIGLTVVTIALEYFRAATQTTSQHIYAPSVALPQLAVLGHLGFDLVLLYLQDINHPARQIAARFGCVPQGEQVPNLVQIETQTLEALNDVQPPQLVFTVAAEASIGPLHGLHETELFIIADGSGGDTGALSQVTDLHC